MAFRDLLSSWPKNQKAKSSTAAKTVLNRRGETIGSTARRDLMHVDDAAGHDTEFTLAESERRLRFALESARQCTWEHEINSGKTFHSSMWKSVLGYKPDELKDGGDI